ncbi:MAG TPA: M15 family metallopeptidase [Tissierellia bacterium]|nr:M15 family metallopeptidase [Tissierellia bacterium]
MKQVFFYLILGLSLAAVACQKPIAVADSPIPGLLVNATPVTTSEVIVTSHNASTELYPAPPPLAQRSVASLAMPIVTAGGYGANISPEDPHIRLYRSVVDPRSIEPVIIETVGLTSLVNKINALPWDYAPTDLIPIDAGGVAGMSLRQEAAAAWEQWRLAALRDGYSVLAVSSYRSRDYQVGLFNRYLASHGDEAILWSAHPRRSEHEMGLALDLSNHYALPGESFGETAMGRYLAETAHLFGFILRYPKGYEADTGYSYEPWHFRYVGLDIADQMVSRSIPTLEHFYQLTLEP